MRARPLVVLLGALIIALLLGPAPESDPLARLRTGISEPTVEMLTHQMKAWHYRPYHVLRELAPRADYLILDGTSGSRNARPEELIAIAGASSVLPGEGSVALPTELPAEALEVRDQNDAGEWAVIVAGGRPPDLMLVVADPASPATVIFLDDRLTGAAGESIRSVTGGSSLRREQVGDRSHLGRFVPAAWAEAIFLLVVLVGGSLLIPRERFPTWAVPSAGMVAGSALLVVVGTGLLALGLPGSPELILLMSVAIVGIVGVRRRMWRREDPPRASSLKLRTHWQRHHPSRWSH